MNWQGYVVIGMIVLIVALSVISTIRFNRKKPMTMEEFEEYEKNKHI